MDLVHLTQAITFLMGLAVFVVYYKSALAHPPEQMKERIWYYTISLSVVVHLLIFYGYIIFVEQCNGYVDIDFTRYWVRGIFIHALTAFLVKEIVAIKRIDLFNGKS